MNWNPLNPLPGMYLDVDPDVYHASRGISSSGLQTCIERSPAHYRYERDNPQRKDYFDVGNVTHTGVMEPTRLNERLHVVDAPNWTTKAAREERDRVRQREPHKYVLNQSQYAEAMQYIRSVREASARFGLDPNPMALFERAAIEVSFAAIDSATGMTVRARPDALLIQQRLIIDLKTDADASPEGFRRNAHKHGYGMRAHAYIETIAGALQEDPADWTFLWVVVEKSAPYAVAMYSSTPTLLQLGARDYRKALDLVASCERTGIWPSYSNTIEPLEPPDWAARSLPRSA